MSYVLAFAGFALLIILHEAGHFTAAKAVGMRVERFALFFPPLLFKVRRGETEYGIGAIPLGGYVRISGMNPYEEIPEEHAHRAYFRQPVWKRIVVIAAGPFVNVVIGVLIFAGIFAFHGTFETTNAVAKGGLKPPALGALQVGDKILAVDGRRGGFQAVQSEIQRHRCATVPPRAGCAATTPARLLIERGGTQRTLLLRPRYNASAKRMLIGFTFDGHIVKQSAGDALSLAVTRSWQIGRDTVKAIARIFYSSKARKDVSGVVGSYEVTQQSFGFDTTQALLVLGIISLSLAVVNLFPFLPLDGGHIFWALAEKIRGKPIPFSVIERASAVGFVLVIMLFVIGLSNDIGRLRGEGFGVR
jgi:regulator of sigma E protease